MIYDVVVVGAGFSAIATVCNLIEQLPPTATVGVIGDDPGFGRGTAYRTELYLHRLNVPAGRMSLFPDRPTGFVDWLARRNRPLREGDFASRQDYGLYLRDTLAGLLRRKRPRCRVDFIRAKATGCVERYNGSLGFFLDNADEVAGRHVILCLGVGNAPLPAPLSGLPVSARSHVIENPWRLSWLRRVQRMDRVCILGSGLTMIDQVMALHAHGFTGRIEVLSRRGVTPLAHARAPVPPAVLDVQTLPTEMSALLHALRQEARSHADWRAVMDGLRHHTQALWQRLPDDARRRFLRHALPWWNIHRHRIAPDIAEQYQTLVEKGQVSVRAGYLLEVTPGAPLRVRYRQRARQQIATIEADWIVNCTGMERAGIAHSPLLREMQRRGMIEADGNGLGIQVDPQSCIESPVKTGASLHAVGALTAGQFWEITAVPDIRGQARQVAIGIAATLASPV